MAKKKEKIKESKVQSNMPKIQFQVRGIELIDFSLNSPNVILPEAHAINYNTNILSRIDKDNKLIYIVVNIDVTDLEQKVKYARVEVSIIFQVNNFEEVVTFKSDSTVHIESHINEILNSISVSTTRGVMFGLFRGTFLHYAILPIIDPTKFVTSPYKPPTKKAK